METEINQKYLLMVWFDLAKIRGSIPDKLIEESLKHYHVTYLCTLEESSEVNTISMGSACSLQ